MRVLVPFAAETPKTRLAPALTAAERSAFASAMLADVVAAIRETGHEPTVVATAPLEDDPADIDVDLTGPLADPDVSVTVDDRPLTAAVDVRLPETAGEATAVVMADLALATPTALERLLSSSADVAIAPGRGGGTNALLVRHPAFRVDYHGTSFLDHREIAREVGADLETVDSFRLGTDVDEPADLPEVLLHGTDRAPACLRAFGFALETSDGRVEVARAGE